MAKLKPCPFCGGEARSTFNDLYYKIFCTNENCGASITKKADVFYCARNDVLDAWNRRAGDAT